MTRTPGNESWILSLGIIAGIIVAMRLYAGLSDGADHRADVPLQVVENSTIGHEAAQQDLALLQSELTSLEDKIATLESELAGIDRTVHPDYERIRSEAETAAREVLRHANPSFAPIPEQHQELPPLSPMEKEFHIRNAQVTVMELYGSHLIAIGLEGDRLNDIIDRLVENEVSKRFDQNLPQPPGSMLVTIPAMLLLSLLPTDEYEAMAQSQDAARNQAEKERMYYEIARFAPQLSYQQKTQIAGVLMAGYDALLAQNTKTSTTDIPTLHADAIDLSRPGLMQEFSREDMQSIDYFLESRRLEKLQSMAIFQDSIR